MEFDVAVTATETTEAKVGVGVFLGSLGIGSQAKSEDGNVIVSRIKFSVPVLYPQQKQKFERYQFIFFYRFLLQ
jgi:hypothetical protein